MGCASCKVHSAIVDNSSARKLPPTLVKVDSQTLPFRASPAVGFGSNNTVILISETHNSLVKYNLQGDRFTKVWEKPCPNNFTIIQRIYILLEGYIVLRDEVQNLTEIYTSDLDHVVYSFPPRYCGELCGLTLAGVLAYVEEIPDFVNCYKVCMYNIHSKHKKVSTLLAPEEHGFGRWLSVCANSQSGWVAVLDSRKDCSILVIFNHLERPKFREKMKFTTVEVGGISSNVRYIFILERHHPCVRILGWQGIQVSEVMLDTLGDFGKWSWIAGLGAGRGRMLQLAAGSWPFVFSVTAFRIQ